MAHQRVEDDANSLTGAVRVAYANDHVPQEIRDAAAEFCRRLSLDDDDLDSILTLWKVRRQIEAVRAVHIETPEYPRGIAPIFEKTVITDPSFRLT